MKKQKVYTEEKILLMIIIGLSIIVVGILIYLFCRDTTETIRDLTTGIRYENVDVTYCKGAITFEYNGETYHLSNYVVE